MKIHNLFFLVESGKAREIAEKHIQSVISVRESNHEYVKQFSNYSDFAEDNTSKQLCGIVFDGEPVDEFRHVDNGIVTDIDKKQKANRQMQTQSVLLVYR